MSAKRYMTLFVGFLALYVAVPLLTVNTDIMPVRQVRALGFSEKLEAGWLAENGDFLVVDVSENYAYLLRKDMSEGVIFPVGSGQKRWVYYVEKEYYAATPTQEWLLKSYDYQPKGLTFGDGLFLRLYAKNDSKYERTHYGIHSVEDERYVFSLEDRFKSLGCILVRKPQLTMLKEVFDVNKKDGVRVITVDDMSRIPLGTSKLRFL